MKNIKLIYLVTILLSIIMSSCSGEEEDCSTNNFLGTWKVDQNICSIHSSPTVSITEGTGSSRIILNLDSDTIPLFVTNCRALHKSSEFLLKKEVVAILNDEEIKIEYNSQVAILPTFCTLKLTK